MWAQAGFDNPLIERSVRNGRPVNDPAKFAYLATRHGTVRFNGLWPRFSCVQGSPNLWGRVEESSRKLNSLRSSGAGLLAAVG